MTKPALTTKRKPATLRCYRASVPGLRDLPDEILVVPWGRTNTPNGPLVFDEYSARVMPGNQAAMGFTRIGGDYEHNSVPRKGHTPKEPQEMAAWGTFVIRKPGEDGKPGLYFRVDEWTESGRAHVGGGHYPGVSIACEQDAAGRVLFAHSIGFVRQPAVPGLSVFNLTLPSTDNDTDTMLKNALIQSLRDDGQTVADDIDDAALVALLTKAGGGTDEPSTFHVKLNTKLDGLATQLTKLTGRIDAAEASAADRERESVIARLTGEGVEIPLSPDMIKRFSAAEILTESAKWPRGTVPVQGADSGNQLAAGAIRTFSSKANDADKAAVAAQLGIDPKDI